MVPMVMSMYLYAEVGSCVFFAIMIVVGNDRRDCCRVCDSAVGWLVAWLARLSTPRIAAVVDVKSNH